MSPLQYSDLFSDIFVPQFSKSNGLNINLPHIKLEEHEYATEEDVLISLKRAISRYSTLQAHDGHWPGDYAGTLFLLPSLVLSLAFKKNNL
jgi:cycloartenol synthase